jgi:hypothetical protein
MRRTLLFSVTTLTAILLWTAGLAQPKLAKFGLDKRVPWTTSKVVGSPEPPPPYKTERVFPKVTFSEPLDLTYGPGTNRMFVAERYGKVYSFVNRPDVEKADLVLELPGKPWNGPARQTVCYAFAFHPKFKENGYMFVTWVRYR